jgi:hypothetical protein
MSSQISQQLKNNLPGFYYIQVSNGDRFQLMHVLKQ